MHRRAGDGQRAHHGQRGRDRRLTDVLSAVILAKQDELLRQRIGHRQRHHLNRHALRRDRNREALRHGRPTGERSRNMGLEELRLAERLADKESGEHRCLSAGVQLTLSHGASPLVTNFITTVTNNPTVRRKALVTNFGRLVLSCIEAGVCK